MRIWPNDGSPRVYSWVSHAVTEVEVQKYDYMALSVGLALTERLKKKILSKRKLGRRLYRRVDPWWEKPRMDTHLFLWSGHWAFWRSRKTIQLREWHQMLCSLKTGKLWMMSPTVARGFYSQRMLRLFKRIEDNYCRGYNWHEAYPVNEKVYEKYFEISHIPDTLGVDEDW